MPEARLIGIGHGQMRERAAGTGDVRLLPQALQYPWCVPPLSKPASTSLPPTPLLSTAPTSSGWPNCTSLRGRVGRSHHQAYAYLLTPHHRAMTGDAVKRLEAFPRPRISESALPWQPTIWKSAAPANCWGTSKAARFTSVGFSLYMDMLDRAVKAIQAGEGVPTLDRNP